MISEHTFHDQQELQQEILLVDWNNTQRDYPAEKCIHELFEQQVARHPNAIAIVFETQTLSYGELNQKANRLAHYLVNCKKIKTETLVGICIDRSIEMVVAVLAVFKAGAAYVPLDPTYPQARLTYMLADANPETVITQIHLLPLLQTHSNDALCIDDVNITKEVALQSDINIQKTVLGLSAHNLAYVIYTSGSTGNPKGSLLQHSGLCNLALAQQAGFEISDNSRVLQFASIAFDAAISEIAVTLCAGARLVLVSNATIKTVIDLEATIINTGTTHATLPPALLPLLNPLAWKSLTHLIIAGDTCSIPIANLWAENRVLINAYGPSETTVCATMGRYEQGQATLHIGKPLSNVQVYVLDGIKALMPISAAGELYIGGVGLSRGYLNHPSLTAEKFIQNPFFDADNPSSSALLYKTGDLVRWLPDGNLEFLGRLDNQVKVRGFRIELGEIENCLAAQDFVKDALVLAKQSVDGDKFLVAYVAVNIDSSITPEKIKTALRQHLQQRLPDYMTPSHFVLLENFPITPNGKIDRKALPEPDTNQRQDYVAPQTELEKKLCNIWQDVLAVNVVGVTDNFYELGGQSLNMIKLITRMQTVGVDILVNEFVKTLTISGTCLLVNSRQLTEKTVYKPMLGAQTISLPNRQLLFKNAYHHHWNIDGIINIENADTAKLERALQAMMHKHEGLRIRYTLESNLVIEHVVAPDNQPILEIVDLSNYQTQAERSAQIETLSKNLQSSLDLGRNLYRFVLFSCGNSEPARFVWIIHHSIIDGYSMGVFLQELFINYLSLVADIDCPLPIATTTVTEWAFRLNDYINSAATNSHVDYWASLPWGQIGCLMDYPEGLTLNKSKNKTNYGQDFSVIKKLDTIYSEKLMAGDWKHREIKTADIIFSAFTYSVSMLSKSQYVHFEMAVSGREKIIHGVDTSRTLGWLIDDIPVFIKVDKDANCYDKVKYYIQQFTQIPAAGMSFNGLKHLSSNKEIRDIFHNIPIAEFAINYVPHNVGQLHDRDIQSEQLSALPFYLLSEGMESRGEAYYVKDIEISRASYIQINWVGDAYQFFWLSRDNIYQKSTIDAILSLWINEIEKIIDTLNGAS